MLTPSPPAPVPSADPASVIPAADEDDDHDESGPVGNDEDEDERTWDAVVCDDVADGGGDGGDISSA